VTENLSYDKVTADKSAVTNGACQQQVKT